jgi:hypothetical protein
MASNQKIQTIHALPSKMLRGQAGGWGSFRAEPFPEQIQTIVSHENAISLNDDG